MSEEPKSEASEPNSDHEAGSEWLPFVIACSVITAVHLTYTFIVAIRPDPWETKAYFGDASGWLNTLFSGFAFAGVIYAIMLQRKELKLQREELKLTRREMARAADAQAKAARIALTTSITESRFRVFEISIEAANHLEGQDRSEADKTVKRCFADALSSAAQLENLVEEAIKKSENR